MMGALEKEVRLSFGQRIRGTLPEPYQPLLPEALDKDTPDFKYTSDGLSSPCDLLSPPHAHSSQPRLLSHHLTIA